MILYCRFHCHAGKPAITCCVCSSMMRCKILFPGLLFTCDLSIICLLPEYPNFLELYPLHSPKSCDLIMRRCKQCLWKRSFTLLNQFSRRSCLPFRPRKTCSIMINSDIFWSLYITPINRDNESLAPRLPHVANAHRGLGCLAPRDANTPLIMWICHSVGRTGRPRK